MNWNQQEKLTNMVDFRRTLPRNPTFLQKYLLTGKYCSESDIKATWHFV